MLNLGHHSTAEYNRYKTINRRQCLLITAKTIMAVNDVIVGASRKIPARICGIYPRLFVWSAESDIMQTSNLCQLMIISITLTNGLSWVDDSLVDMKRWCLKGCLKWRKTHIRAINLEAAILNYMVYRCTWRVTFWVDRPDFAAIKWNIKFLLSYNYFILFLSV